MFMMTAKLTRARAIAGVLAGGAVLCAAVFAAGHAFDARQAAPSPEGMASNEQRVAYLSAWGWEVEPSATETLELTLPEEPDEAFLSYNELQAENGMDLTAYCGQHVKRYAYTVCNYPDYDGTVLANLYLCGDTVAAGDITAPGENGFRASLRYPS